MSERTYVFALGIAFMAASYGPIAQDPKPLPGIDPSGIYRCQGRQAGKNYHGVTIIRKEKDVYIVQWLMGDQHYLGIGIRKDDNFTVAWNLRHPTPGASGLTGVNYYEIQGRKLVGRWAALPGTGNVNHETLEFLEVLPPDDKDPVDDV